MLAALWIAGVGGLFAAVVLAVSGKPDSCLRKRKR